MVETVPVTDNDRRMADGFSGYIANFVRSGNPSGDDLPDWPLFDPAALDLMHFTLDDALAFFGRGRFTTVSSAGRPGHRPLVSYETSYEISNACLRVVNGDRCGRSSGSEIRRRTFRHFRQAPRR